MKTIKILAIALLTILLFPWSFDEVGILLKIYSTPDFWMVSLLPLVFYIVCFAYMCGFNSGVDHLARKIEEVQEEEEEIGGEK